MSYLIKHVGFLPSRTTNVILRDFIFEKMIQKAEAGKELVLQNLWDFNICTLLFPNSVISDEIIQFKEWIVLRRPRTLKVVQLNRAIIWARFPAGSVFQLKNGILEVVHQLNFGFHPVLSVLSIGLNIPRDKIGNFVINTIRHLDESLYASRQWCNNLFHRTSPIANVGEMFVDCISYLPLEPVIYNSSLYISLLNDMPPLKFQEKAFDIVYDNTYAALPPLAENIYNFSNEYGIVETQAYKIRMPDGKIINLPVSALQSNDTGIKMINYQPFRTPSPLLNGELLKSNPGSEAVLTHSLDYAEELTKFLMDHQIRDVVPLSWIGNINDVNLTDCRFKDVNFMVSEIEGLSFSEGSKIATYLMQRFDETVKFKCIVDTREGLTAPMEWEAFRTYCGKHHGLQLPVDPKDQIAIIERALLKSSEDIEDRPVIIEGFAKLGKIYVIGGGPKTGKSLFGSRLGYQISIGGEIWNFKMKKQRVLYLDTEMDDDDYKDRNLADKQHDGFKIILAQDLDLPDEIADADDMTRLTYLLDGLHKYALTHKFNAIFIDCLYRLLSESSGKQINHFVSKLKTMKRDGLFLCVLHHLNKSELDAVDPFKNLSGHSNFQRAVDGGILLLPEEECSDDGARAMKVKFLSRSFPPISDLDIVLKDGVHMTASEAGRERPRKDVDILKAFIRGNLSESSKDAMEMSASS